MRRKTLAVAAIAVALAASLFVLARFAPAADAATVAAHDNGHAVVGAWYVDTVGAPFLGHNMAFLVSDGVNVVLIDNPDAAEAHNSSSSGKGGWKVRNGAISGQFLEVNANKDGPTANKFWSNLMVKFRITVRGDRFEGPALATYYDGAGRPIAGLTDLPATLKGQRITDDSPAPVVFVP